MLLSAFALCTSSPVYLKSNDDSVGFRVAVTQAGAQKFMDIIVPMVLNFFQHFNIPDIHTEIHAPVLGKVDVDVTEIVVQSLQLPGYSVKMGPDAGVIIGFSGVGLKITSKIHWRQHKWPHVKDHVSCEIRPKKGDISVGAAFTVDASTGRATSACSASVCDFDAFDMKFSGHWDSWLYNLIAGLLKKTIKKSVDEQVAAQMKNFINVGLNAALQKLPLTTHVGGGAARVNYYIGLSSVVGSASYLSIGTPMAATNNQTQERCTELPTPMPVADTGATGRHLQLFMNQAIFDCGVWVPYINNLLQLSLPSQTSAWALFVPALVLKYPNSNMTLKYTAKSKPQVTITPKGMNAVLDFSMDASVLTPDPVHVFTLGQSMTLGLSARVGPSKEVNASATVYLNVTQIQTSFSVQSTDIGPIDPTLLQKLADFVAPLVIKAVDTLLASGFPIPFTEGFTLANPAVVQGDGYLGVAADIAWRGR